MGVPQFVVSISSEIILLMPKSASLSNPSGVLEVRRRFSGWIFDKLLWCRDEQHSFHGSIGWHQQWFSCTPLIGNEDTLLAAKLCSPFDQHSHKVIRLACTKGWVWCSHLPRKLHRCWLYWGGPIWQAFRSRSWRTRNQLDTVWLQTPADYPFWLRASRYSLIHLSLEDWYGQLFRRVSNCRRYSFQYTLRDKLILSITQ